jgi:hypothetical protein
MICAVNAVQFENDPYKQTRHCLEYKLNELYELMADSAVSHVTQNKLSVRRSHVSEGRQDKRETEWKRGLKYGQEARTRRL